MIYQRHMHQQATYWPPASNDGFGGHVFGPPQVIRCRWQDDAQLFRTPEGREAVSASIVYTACPVVIGGRLAVGRHHDQVPVPGASTIEQVSRSPDLSGRLVLHKAFL